jgi:hypothetical protein
MTEGSPMTEGSAWRFAGGAGRQPVDLVLPPPRRRTAAELGDRRPVVAILDTGISPHEWLDVPAPVGSALPEDGFTTVDAALQATILAAQEQLIAAGHPLQRLRDAWERQIRTGSVAGELGSHTGHGTFIGGLVRQVAPDATVLQIRVMHSDGVVYESDLLIALDRLADQVEAAQAGTGGAMVDVVCLSLGYYLENAADTTYTIRLQEHVDRLLAAGVVVVAAAGNHATSREFYPAALPCDGELPVMSVGAFQPNDAKAMFSNDGPWVRYWAPGSALVSTYPKIQGSRGAAYATPAGNAGGRPARRETLDADDYTRGFASWSGSSFAAGLGAAEVAALLLANAADDPQLRLDQVDAKSTVQRALRALDGFPG